MSKDVKRHVHNLKSSVYVVSGQVKGKTLLPLPVGAEKVDEEVENEEKYVLFYSHTHTHKYINARFINNFIAIYYILYVFIYEM